jgi:dihydrofolate reductase
LLDELILFIAPILLKKGIPLYPSLNKKVNLKLLDTASFKTGLVKLHYAPAKKEK